MATRPKSFGAYSFDILTNFLPSFFGCWMSFSKSNKIFLALFRRPPMTMFTFPRLTNIMKSSVFPFGHKLQILNAIIESIPIYMMNNLIGFKWSSQILFHNISMLKNVFAINTYKANSLVYPSIAFLWFFDEASRASFCASVGKNFPAINTIASGFTFYFPFYIMAYLASYRISIINNLATIYAIMFSGHNILQKKNHHSTFCQSCLERGSLPQNSGSLLTNKKLLLTPDCVIISQIVP